MNKILISPSSFGECGSEPLDLLKNAGFEVVPNPYGRKLTENETISLGSDIIGAVAGVETYNSAVFDKLKNLKCISRCTPSCYRCSKSMDTIQDVHFETCSHCLGNCHVKSPKF